MSNLHSNTDWDSVTIIRKSKLAAKDLKSAAAVNRALATGNAEILKKNTGGTNKNASLDINLAKIEQSDELKVPTVSKDVAKAIQAGRQKLGITQKDLAQKICEKPTVVNDYENGKAIPSQAILGKLERVLGIKLRGANIGAPLH